jgi:hypothetical protein
MIRNPYREPSPTACSIIGPEMMQIDHDIAEPVPLQEQEIPHDQRRARDGGEAVSNRAPVSGPLAISQARCEDHGFHGAS